jgi:hypothetical protein
VAVTTEARAPRVRCYGCQSSRIQALCHHCWRPGCARHVRPSPRWAERLFGAEAGGSGLENIRAWHCADCNHVHAGWTLKAGTVGLTLVLAGLLTMVTVPVSLVIGVLLIVVGGTTVAWACAHIRHRSALARGARPVPLHPRVSNVRLLERLRTRIELGQEGEYLVRADPVNGELTAILTFGADDVDRVRSYGDKHKLSAGQQVRYNIGCFVPQGRLGITELRQDQVVRVDGDVSGIEAFRPVDAPASSRLRVRLPYRLSEAIDTEAGPLWITPSIRPGSQRHVLELDIQWTEFGPKVGKPLALETIELLKIIVPAGWGNVERFSHRPDMVSLSDTPDGTPVVREVEWRHVLLDGSERETRHLTIAVQFEEQVDASDVLSGYLAGTMKGTLSGADGVRMYNALGGWRAIPGGASVRTRVEADFTLSLASIRYQAVRVFPDQMDTSSCAVESDVIPGDGTVIALTNALGEEGFYVKRVTENAPRGGGRPEVVHRVWDIAGRCYQGVYPVDFHVVLTGDEVHRGDVRPESGSTKIQIVVQGAYTDDEMYKQVENTWTQLRAVTREALTGCAPPAYGPSAD